MVGPWPPGPGAAPSGAPAPGPEIKENKKIKLNRDKNVIHFLRLLSFFNF
jgi:hypothetical protein